MSKNKNNKPPRNSFVQAMNARNKTQIFKHKTEPRGGDTNEQRDFLEDLEDEEEPEFKSTHCGSCGGMVELTVPSDSDKYIFSVTGKNQDLVDYQIPKDVLIPKCNNCGDTYFSPWDDARIVAAIYRDYDLDCVVTMEQVQEEMESLEAKIALSLGITNSYRDTLVSMHRSNELHETYDVSRWLELYSIFMDNQKHNAK